jgi:hypothetical protein
MEVGDEEKTGEQKTEEKTSRGIRGVLLTAVFTFLRAVIGVLGKGYFDLANEKQKSADELKLEEKKMDAEVQLERQKFDADLVKVAGPAFYKKWRYHCEREMQGSKRCDWFGRGKKIIGLFLAPPS